MVDSGEKGGDIGSLWYKWSWLVGISERVGLLFLASSFEVSEVAGERGIVKGVKSLKGGVDEGEGGDGGERGERGPS